MNTPTRIYAPTMHEALQRISRELGEDAVIIESREVGGGVEVVAAIDASAPRTPAPAVARKAAASRDRAAPERPVTSGRRTSRSSITGGSPRPGSRPASPAGAIPGRGPDAPGWVRSRLRFLPHDVAPRTGRLLFLGASGVGKTLLIAKLAAAHVLRYGPAAVRLINGDAFRFGGQTQLERLAGMLGVDWLQLHRPEDLRRAVAGSRPHDLVLIDTPGLRARPGDASVDWVGTMCEATESQRCLVLSATAQRAATRAVVRQAREIGVDFLTLTKLDEPADPMEVLEPVSAAGLPLAWLGTGDMIPDDVEPATADTLNAWLGLDDTEQSAGGTPTAGAAAPAVDRSIRDLGQVREEV